MNETIQKHSTNNARHGKYKYAYYQNTHTLQKPYIHTPTDYKTHTYTHPHNSVLRMLTSKQEEIISEYHNLHQYLSNIIRLIKSWKIRRTMDISHTGR
jgi:hypothetical protein